MYYLAENKCRSCSKVFCCRNCRANHEVNKHARIPGSSISSHQNSFKTPQERQHWPQYCVLCHKVFQNITEFNQQRKCALATGYKRPNINEKNHPVLNLREDNESPPFLQTGLNFKNLKSITNRATSTPMQRCDNVNFELENLFKTPDDLVEQSGQAAPLKVNQTGTLKRRVTFGSVTTPRPSSSPIRESTSPIRGSTSPVRESTSPVRESTSPIRGSTSPIRESTSPIRSSTSPIRESTSPIRSSTSPTRSSTGGTSNRMSNDNRSAASQGTFYTANEEFLKNNINTPSIKSPKINEEDPNDFEEVESNNDCKENIMNHNAEEAEGALENSIWESAINITNSFLYDAQIVDTDLEQQLSEAPYEQESDAGTSHSSEIEEEASNLQSECIESYSESLDKGSDQQEFLNITQPVIISSEASERNDGDNNVPIIPAKTSKENNNEGDTENNTSKTENDNSVSNEGPGDEIFSTPLASKQEIIHKVLRTKFGNTVKISSTPKTYNLLTIHNSEDLVTSGSNLEISNIKPEELKIEPCTSTTESIDKNDGGLWGSIAKVIENAVSMVQSITKTDDSSQPIPTGSLKRYSSSFDLTDQPALKRYKLTDIKCRRAIRELPPISISRNSQVNIVNNFKINIVNNYDNRVKIFVDKSTQTEE